MDARLSAPDGWRQGGARTMGIMLRPHAPPAPLAVCAAPIAGTPSDGRPGQAIVVDDESLPWLPWSPRSSKGASPHSVIRIKHFRLDPVRGEMVSIIRVPVGVSVPRFAHAAPAVVYTLEGHWKFAQYDWIASPGSVVLIPEKTPHQIEATNGRGDVLALHITTGDVALLDAAQRPQAILNWKTALARYLAYCRQHCIEPKDLTAP